jgi:hypothetical protein
VYTKVTGNIVHVGPNADVAHLHLRAGATLPAGATVKIVQRGTSAAVVTGILEVTESQPGWANARLTNLARGQRLLRGAEIEAWR